MGISPPPSEPRFGTSLSGDSFRLLVQSVRDYAIFMLDPDGFVISWNIGAERLKGYRSDEIIGKHFSVFYPQDDLDEGKPAMELRIAAAEGHFEDEGWRLRQDGSRFWANVVITALYENGVLRGFGKVTRDMTQRVRDERAVSEGRRLFAHLVEAQETERRRIAWDVHDDAIQAMVAVSMRLQILAGRLTGDGRLVAERLVQGADAAITRLRDLVFRLRPPSLDGQGLVDTLASYLEETADDWRMDYRLDHELDREPPSAIATTAFRIVQEALTNVHRHARATEVRLSLASVDQGLLVKVVDNGTGAVPDSADPAHPSENFGLADMRERAQAVGGWWELHAEPGRGTTVRFWLPTDVLPLEKEQS
jgi:PAS domain S-box-containing protein